MMSEVRNFNQCLLAGVASLALSACGGDGSDSNPSPNSGSSAPPSSFTPPPTTPPPSSTPPDPSPTPATVSGVAAVGAPLVGTVTVKDATGASKTVPIGSNGSYLVDVTGMTAPFVFRAQGTSNGHMYVVHSAAAAADVNGTINITQLTDLVVDNIAGQLASSYFDNGDFATLSKTALDAEVGKLKEKLLPVLQALGVDATIDLLRSKFTPLASAFDSALDILRVSVDSTTHIATITNIVTQQQIQDDITLAAAAEASPAQLTDTTNVAESASDIALVYAALSDFTAKFAGGLPSSASLAASLTGGFRNDDEDGPSFAAELSSDSSLVGASFTDVNIRNIDYSDLTKVTANVDFTVKDRDGIEFDRLENFKIRKGLDGTWRLHGNQRVLLLQGYAHMLRSSGTYTCAYTGIEFDIEDYDSGNNGGAIDHIVISGPGLPAAGLRYNAPPTGGTWSIQNQTFPYYIMGNSCGNAQGVSDALIAAIPDDAFYTLVAYTSADNSVRLDFPSGAIDRPGQFANGAYGLSIQKRPLTLAETVASTAFPTIRSPASAAAFSTYMSGDLPISASGMNPDFYAVATLERNTSASDFRSTNVDVAPDSGGILTTSLLLTAAANGDSITRRALRVSGKDTYRRLLTIAYDLGTTP